MGATTGYRHLTTDPDGTVRIGQTRYKVSHLAAEHYHYGWTAEELMRQHPDLRPEEVYAALTYFYDHRDEIVDAIGAAPTDAPPGHATHLSREELLRRREHGA